MNAISDIRCYYVNDASGKVTASVRQRPFAELPDGNVVVEVKFSSVNYKDALAASGHPGVAGKLPHVPGIDAAGTVIDSSDDRYAVGDPVVITGYGLGSDSWGGWSTHVRVPGDWIIPKPQTLSLFDAMALGTAGFTAAQCVESLRRHGVDSSGLPILVTGATGGVGTVAVMLLAKLGFQVVAVTGKDDQHEHLRDLGATKIVSREEIIDGSKRPLLKGAFAGAVDTVGGNMLADVLRQVDYRGCVTACGLVGGHELSTTVYPFILRGITLDGIDSAKCPRPHRESIWKQLANDWHLPNLTELTTTISMDDLTTRVAEISTGKVVGRTVVQIKPSDVQVK